MAALVIQQILIPTGAGLHICCHKLNSHGDIKSSNAAPTATITAIWIIGAHPAATHINFSCSHLDVSPYLSFKFSWNICINEILPVQIYIIIDFCLPIRIC